MPAEPSPLVGRASLLSAIGRGAREGTGAVLTGAPGSGGTRLLADAFAATRRAGLKAARLQPAGDARGPLGSFLPLFERGVLDGVPADEDRIRSSAMALGLHAVFLDDAHLLDDDAGALLVDLARRGTAVVANATGPGGVPEALRLLVEEGRASTIELAPLTDDEVAELAGHLLGDPVDGELAIALVTASGGRPGTLSEVVDAGVGASAIVHTDGLWRLAAPLPVGRSVRASVLDAFSALPPDQRGWIAAVAQAGTIADDLTRWIAGGTAIDAALAAGWTIRDEDRRATRIAFPAVATAVLGSLELRARIAVLRRLVAAADASGRTLEDAERVSLALWRIELGDRPDPAEARLLAGLQGTDPAAREVLLRAAMDGGAPAGAELADHLRLTRRSREALELIDAVLPDAATDGERVALIRVRYMATGIVERRSEDALAALDAVLEDLPHPDLLAVRASMLVLEGRPAEAAVAAERTLEHPERSPFATAFALLQLAFAHRELGDLDTSTACATRLGSVGREDAFANGAALARWLPWELAVAVGAETGMEEQLVAALEAVPAERRALGRPPLTYTLAGVRLLRGDPAAAVRLLRDADAGSGAWCEGWKPRLLAELAIASTLAGDLDGADAVLDRLRRITQPPVQRARGELAAAQLAHARGDAGLARSLAAATADRGRRAGLALDAFDATFAGIRYGDEGAPGRLLDLGEWPTGAGREAQRAYARALVGGDAAAVDLAAVGLWEAGLRLFAVEAAMRAATLGSAAAATRVVAWRARTPSLRLPVVGERRAAGLTAREREVALLAARGCSDRAIALELGITLRTAQTHLGRAFAKLGIHRRTELRGLVAEP